MRESCRKPVTLLILSSVESRSQVTRTRLGRERAARSDWLSCSREGGGCQMLAKFPVFSVSGMFIPDPNFFHSGSWIRIFSIPDPNFFQSRIRIFPSRISDPNFSIPDPNFFHPGSEFFHPDPRSEFFPSQIPDPHQRITCFKTQKIVYKLSEIWSGLFIPDPDPDFLPIPNPGV